jgi:hypothetical protein
MTEPPGLDPAEPVHPEQQYEENRARIILEAATTAATTEAQGCRG